MSYDETFVGGIAIAFGLFALVTAIGPWESPYRLRTIAAVQTRFGKPAARGLWVIVAIISILSGLAISNGVRPSYASPSHQDASP